jgi:thiamine-phosphate pyrophosphorylase
VPAFSFDSPLYAITPDLADDPQLLSLAGAALEAGATLLQYRDKISPPAQRLARARALRALCDRHNARLIVNDDLVLALACDADGVHLGGTDGSIRDARRLLPPGMIIGASCYNDLALAQQALAEGASYVAFGACFDSPTKPAARRVSTEQLAAFREALGPDVAICGIGGITLGNVAQLDGKVDTVALISELFGTPHQPASPEHVRAQVRQFIAESLAV